MRCIEIDLQHQQPLHWAPGIYMDDWTQLTHARFCESSNYTIEDHAILPMEWPCAYQRSIRCTVGKGRKGSRAQTLEGLCFVNWKVIIRQINKGYMEAAAIRAHIWMGGASDGERCTLEFSNLGGHYRCEYVKLLMLF